MNPNRPFYSRALLGGMFSAALAAASPAAEDPSPAEIQRMVRYSQALQQAELVGQLRSGSNRVPFAMSLRGETLVFAFDNPRQVIELRKGSDEYVLAENGRELSAGRYGERIRGTDITYEDLSMRFLYWPGARLDGKDIVKNRTAWVLSIPNPRRSGPYSNVRIWVDVESGGLMRVEGYDWGGQSGAVARKIKMYEVLSGQKIDGNWMLEKMRVETYDPASGKTVGRTYLELRKR